MLPRHLLKLRCESVAVHAERHAEHPPRLHVVHGLRRRPRQRLQPRRAGVRHQGRGRRRRAPASRRQLLHDVHADDRLAQRPGVFVILKKRC